MGPEVRLGRIDYTITPRPLVSARSFYFNEVTIVPTNRALVLKKTELIDSEGNVYRYIEEFVEDNCRLPAENEDSRSRTRSKAIEWLSVKQAFEGLPAQKQKIERAIGYFGLSKYQIVFEQEDLTEQFDWYNSRS